MRRFFQLPRPTPETKKSRSRPRPNEPSPISNLPYEVVENILIFAWHSEYTALPGGGRFTFDALSSLLPNPHTKLTTSNETNRPKDGYFPTTRELIRISLVCSQWAEIMRTVVLTYVPLTTLSKYNAYAHLVGVDGDENEKARRLCKSIHVDIPTGNLSKVPSWSSIPPLLTKLDNLVHLTLTAAEPHPALFKVLSHLPITIHTLDIHISSPYIYKRPLIGGNERLRIGLSHVKHLLINVLDSLLLECLLEGFGSLQDESSTKTSPSLQTLLLQGPHDLTSSHITNTISHSHTIHTLKLYPHTTTNPTFQSWNAQNALSNEAWFPALERLVLQLSPFEKTMPVWEEVKEVCNKRGMRVELESVLV